MAEYKLIGARENETKEEAIIRCANNLIKAVIAAGYSVHSTSDMSSVDIAFYSHIPDEIYVQNIMSHWSVRGKCPIKISFKPTDKELMLDE